MSKKKGGNPTLDPRDGDRNRRRRRGPGLDKRSRSQRRESKNDDSRDRRRTGSRSRHKIRSNHSRDRGGSKVRDINWHRSMGERRKGNRDKIRRAGARSSRRTGKVIRRVRRTSDQLGCFIRLGDWDSLGE